MAQSIVSVGVDIPGEDATTISIDSTVSLLDWDITVFRPEIYGFFDRSYQTYQGKPSLSDDKSFNLKEKMAHWRREILDAVAAGKVVFVLLDQVQTVFVATGDVQYSGTGRSRQTTRIVSETNNYAFCPVAISPTNSTGSAMLVDPKAIFFADYWQSIGEYSEYRVVIANPKVTRLVMTKSGSRLVSGYVQDSRSMGALVFLPFVRFDGAGFVRLRDGEPYWTKKAVEFGNRFTSSIARLADALRKQSERTPPPDWLRQPQFLLTSEKSIQQQLLQLESEMQKLANRISQEKETLAEETVIKGLLFEKGKPLETAILRALRILGFKAEPYRQSDSEFDVVFESGEGRLLAEAEGKDNKAINVDKLRQLQMNINEDYAREDVSQMAKGVLIGNAYRMIPPSERGAFFTEKCTTAATKSNTALVRSVDLFLAAREVLETNDDSKAAQFRRQIVDTVGLVQFPVQDEDTAPVDAKDGT